MNKPRQLINGDLIYPHRGNPPAPEKGFEADPKDLFVHHKIYPPCSSRKLETRQGPCGVKKYFYFCEKMELPNMVNANICEACNERENNSNN